MANVLIVDNNKVNTGSMPRAKAQKCSLFYINIGVQVYIVINYSLNSRSIRHKWPMC